MMLQSISKCSECGNNLIGVHQTCIHCGLVHNPEKELYYPQYSGKYDTFGNYQTKKGFISSKTVARGKITDYHIGNQKIIDIYIQLRNTAKYFEKPFLIQQMFQKYKQIYSHFDLSHYKGIEYVIAFSYLRKYGIRIEQIIEYAESQAHTITLATFIRLNRKFSIFDKPTEITDYLYNYYEQFYHSDFVRNRLQQNEISLPTFYQFLYAKYPIPSQFLLESHKPSLSAIAIIYDKCRQFKQRQSMSKFVSFKQIGQIFDCHSAKIRDMYYRLKRC